MWTPGPEVRALLDPAPLTILVRDTDGNYLYANHQALQRVARRYEELVSTSVVDVFPEREARELLKQDLEVVSSGQERVFEAELPLPDGTLRTYLLAKYPVVPGPGLPTVAATVATDITEQRDLAHALRESELRFRQLTESIEDVFSLYSVGRVESLYVSPSAADVYGVPLTEGDADSTAYMRTIDPDDVPLIMAMLDHVAAERTGAEVPFRVHHPTRGLRWMRARGRPVTGPEGDLRIATVVNDITADRQLQEELTLAREVAEEANARKNEFLSQMSHELRTPLNAILGFSQLLELDGHRLESDQIDHVRHIRRAGQHLLDLINDILDMTRIERGAVELTPEVVDVGALVADVCQLLDIQARARDVTLDDGTGCDPAAVLADRQRLTQVLINLVGNAIKYNRPDGRVEVTWRREGTRVHLQVSDTGAGISSVDLERLFTPFERLGRAESVEGTGIGLALSRQLVQAMGGVITVESEVGLGTTFSVDLPADRGSDPG